MKAKKKKTNKTKNSKFIRIKGFFKKFYANHIKKYTPNIYWMAMPFILMEVFIYIFGSNISYTKYLFISPLLFMITWLILFLGLSISLNKVLGKIVYILFNLVFMFLFLLNNVYYSMTKTFFDFNLMESAGEGSAYIMDAIKNCNVLVYIAFIIIFAFFVFALKNFYKAKKTNYKALGLTILIFTILHLLVPLTFGKANTDLTWSSWRNPRNVYNAFNDNNKSMRISGFYEYCVRNFYVSFIKTEEEATEEDMEFLKSSYQESAKHKNSYTGKFKGKNLIIVQLEGTDKWLINKNDTPTMYKLMSQGINFNNHYSFYTGGGSTFNSEFAINTGFITPISYTKNAYSFNKNSFPNSLAKQFKNEGYQVNVFHMNEGEFYSRTSNYKNWGYDNYYGLMDMGETEESQFMLDTELVLNEQFNSLMFPTEGNFVDYIITYSGHLPFTNAKGVCKYLYDRDMDKIEESTGVRPEFKQMTEDECTRRQARETDDMVTLLLENLSEKGLIDNTVLLFATDHYLYTLEDKSLLDKNHKITSNNLINNTPMFIWAKGIKKNTVKKVTSQINVLPTLMNLYGISYNTNDYI